MDRLPPETQEQIRKMGTERLRVKLGKAGYDEDRLLEMERAELLEAWVEVVIAQSLAEEASRVPLPTDHSSSIGSEVGAEAARLRELELEDRRAEREERKAEREAAERKAAREAEERRAQREAEERRAEREGKKSREGRSYAVGAGQISPRDEGNGAEG